MRSRQVIVVLAFVPEKDGQECPSYPFLLQLWRFFRSREMLWSVMVAPGRQVSDKKGHLLFLGVYPFHTHSMACGRNCDLALRMPWPAFRQKRYW